MKNNTWPLQYTHCAYRHLRAVAWNMSKTTIIKGTIESIGKLHYTIIVYRNKNERSLEHKYKTYKFGPISPCLVMWPEWILRISKRLAECIFHLYIYIYIYTQWQISNLASFGKGISILRSRRPGRSRAGSKVSGLRITWVKLIIKWANKYLKTNITKNREGNWNCSAT